MIQLNYKDPRPIYEQVMDSLRRLVVSGVMKPDEKLPSVRELATSLTINPNTIQRAYRELETEGYIYTVSGRGSFVSPKDYVKDIYKESLLETFGKTVSELFALGENPETLTKQMQTLYGKETISHDSDQ